MKGKIGRKMMSPECDRIPNVAKVSYVSQTPSFVLNENIEREKDEEEPNIFIL